jgi:hypothetical protein
VIGVLLEQHVLERLSIGGLGLGACHSCE